MDKRKIIFNFLQIGAFLYREGNRIVSEFGINQQQFVVLRFISNHQPINQKEIYSHLLFEKSNLSKIIKKLETLDLVKKKVSTEDNRFSILTIKPKGKTIIKNAMKKFESYNSNLLKEFSKQEIYDINKSLDIFINKMREK
jgi:DNA-binding MarR family transcriptional regulator